MKKRTTLLLLTLSSVAWSQTPENSDPLNALPGEVWEIKTDRSDDFGVDTDNTEQSVNYSKWQRNPAHVQTWTWDNDNNCKQKNGVLSITARFDDAGADRTINQNCGGVTTDLFYTSGLLKSIAKGTYGYYEARIKGADLFPGVSPAFWMFSDIDDSITEEGEIRYSEVDVVEMTQRGDLVAGNETIMDHNLHAVVATRFRVTSNGYDFELDASGNRIPLSEAEFTTNRGRRWFRPGNPELHDAQENVSGERTDPNRFDPRVDFHTYGCKITEEKITWYVDNRIVGEKLNDKWHREMNVALSLGIRAPYTTFCDNAFSLPTREFALANRDKFPQTMQVDYVRVWELREGTSAKSILNTSSSDSTVSIYPNPVTGDAFKIEFKKVTKDVVVEILDVNGKLLMNLEEVNKQTIELPVDGLKAGLYFVKINAKNSTPVTKKIVVQ